MKKILAATVSVAALMLSTHGVIADTSVTPEHMKKLGDALMHVSENARKTTGAMTKDVGMMNHSIKLAEVTSDGYVLVDAVASGEAKELVAMLESVGAKQISSYGKTVSAQVPANKLTDMALSDTMAFAKPALMTTNAGLVRQRGDRSIRTQFNRRQNGLDGEGFTVGILSDSYACDPGRTSNRDRYTTPAQDVENNDLPSGTIIRDDLDDRAICTDEGRAMAQIIYDAVPGVKFIFHTAFNGQADFANGIIELARDGADVIVDDVLYFTEPMFQDGIIAQAVDQAASMGVPYYSAAGNLGRASYETEYRPVNTGIGTLADFDPGAGVDLVQGLIVDGVDIGGGIEQTTFSFQWDSPNLSAGGLGAQNDVDIMVFNADASEVIPNCPSAGPGGSGPEICVVRQTDGGNGGDAIEVLSILDTTGGATVQLAFLTETGDAPEFVKYVVVAGNIAASEYPLNASTSYGHSNAAGGESVAASAFFFNRSFIGNSRVQQVRANAGEQECVPACLNDFSSAGGTPILFDVNGNRLPSAEVRLKPGVTAADGVNTSFFSIDLARDDDDSDGVFRRRERGEFPNFFGTSAAAPNAAAAAVQMLQSVSNPIRFRDRENRLRFRMCRPDGRSVNTRRGQGRIVRRLNRGFTLGSCDRPSPEMIYDVMRDTARDMTVRASVRNGATVQIFDEVGPSGFDFDSGFGFINAGAAVRVLRNRLDQ